MPTARRRHLITETDPVAAALDDAAEVWPAFRDSRARLLVLLVERGHEALAAQRADERTRQIEAVRRTAGVLSGTYEPGYLEDLRSEWPGPDQVAAVR